MIRVALFVMSLLGLVACQQPADIAVTDARVRAVLPGMDKTAGYLNIANGTDRAKVLVAVSMPGVRAIEMHETAVVDGMMRMRRLEHLTIPAQGEVRLQPGGKHLMLFGVEAVPEEIPATLHWQEGGELPVLFRRLSN